jgi:hypothetical protein
MSSDINAPLAPPSPGLPVYTVPPECVPNLDELVIEDGEPVDNIFAEKQHRLLTEPLYSSWGGPGEGKPFLALANVGLFFADKQPPLAPDVMLGVDVQLGADLSRRENHSWFNWILGKAPDVAIEFVSDRRGGEEDYKRDQYARIGVTYYVIFDPANRLRNGVLRSFVLSGGEYQPLTNHWFPRVNLGLTLWEGGYEGHQGRWLRWCDAQRQVIPTGAERADQQRQRADQQRQRADQQRQRADQECERRERLEARLRELGLEP